MADVKGDLSVKNKLDVRQNAKFFKGVDIPYVEIIDQKDPGILGGGTSPNIWTSRDLTVTVKNDFATSINLSAAAGDGADFTLPAGEYYIEASCPGFNCDNHVARLADVDVNPEAVVVLGTIENSGTHGAAADTDDLPTQTRSEIVGRFSLPLSTRLEIQHQLETEELTCGFGAGANFYETSNVYTTVRIWQIRDDDS